MKVGTVKEGLAAVRRGLIVTFYSINGRRWAVWTEPKPQTQR